MSVFTKGRGNYYKTERNQKFPFLPVKSKVWNQGQARALGMKK
jgi:hypothetical protein